MLISFNWLKQYIDLPDSTTPEEVAERLKSATVEVEKIIRAGENLEGIVVGKVVSAEKHPNADKLKVCQVDIGGGTVQIVCGGSNVEAGMLVAVAKLGSKVKWHGEGEPIEMKEAEIRGVKSFGMICASTEIGLGEMFPIKSEKEILDLSAIVGERDSSATLGMTIDKLLGLNDAVLEVDNKSLSNRPDLWGHYGIAREVAVLFKKPLKDYKIEGLKDLLASKKSDVKIKVNVEDAKLCPRYMAVAVSGVVVGPSPAWLQQKLVAIGLRPINNIVDITNYVMNDVGEPMHAFDKLKVQSSKLKVDGVNIVVRKAKDGEEFKTLDGANHKLDNSMLVIANGEKPLALAGVMGGEESGISDATTDIVFEAANFDASSIRKTSTKLGLRTDSSARFEKALDPNLCALAIAKAVELTLQICPTAKVASKVVDEKSFKLYQGPIEIAYDFFDQKIGQVIERKDIVAILTRLGFEIKEKKNSLLVKIPSWRATKDIGIAEDLVEEVARIYGYDKIAPVAPLIPTAPAPTNDLRALEHQISAIASMELGYSEVYNYSFVSAQQIKNFGADVSKFIELNNPLANDRPYLRRNLLPGLLTNVASNIENFPEVKIFEIGKTFKNNEAGSRARENSDELLPRQDTWGALVFASRKEKSPYWQARRAWETIALSLGLDWSLAPVDKVQNWEHPGRLALVAVNGKTIGVITEVNPAVAANFGIDVRVGALTINLSALSELDATTKTKYLPLSKFPAVTRDLALVVKKSVSHAEIMDALSSVDPLLTKVELFDVYEGATIGDELKSMAYRLSLAHPQRTLKSEEVDRVMEKARDVVIKLGGEMRG